MSAFFLFLRITATVFAAEALVMFILARLLPPLGNWWGALVDPTLLALLVTPLLWRWLVLSDRQRQRAEESLHLQSAALTAAANAIVITDRDGTVVWANQAFTTLTGYTLAEVIGRNLWDLVKSGRHERAVYEQMWETILAGRIWRGELVNRRKDGSFYTEDQTITPVRDVAGGIAHFIAIKQDLTERNLALKKLYQREAELKEAQRIGRLGHWDWDTTTDTITWSEEYYHICDIDPKLKPPGYEEHLKLYTAESAARLDAAVKHCLQTGEVYELDLEQVRSDSTRGWITARGEVKRSADGRIVGLCGTAQDITARKQAEVALHEANTRYRLLFEQSPDGIVIINPETGRLIESNETAHRQLGYSREEFARLNISDIEAAETPEQTRSRIASVTRKGRSDFETQHRTRQGGIRDIQVTAQFTEVAGQSVYHCVWRDITERKEAERQLREQNDILSHAHEGVMVVNLTNQVTLWNHGAEAIFGWTEAEALGRPPDQLLGNDDPGVVSTLLAAIEHDGFWTGELRAQTRDGRKLTVEARVTLVRNEAGRPRARLTFLTDVTEKKSLEEKLLHAQRLESIGMLAAGIAHDLNNVLSPIVFAAPLLRKSVSAPRDVKILDTLERSAARGTGLVQQILGFAQSASGELRPTQVKHIARDIVGVIEETFPKSIQFEHHLPSDLWLVQGNATQIHQVLLNLCVNARDAMLAGGTLRLTAANRRLEVADCGAIAGARPGDWVVLEVADTGTGIAPEVLARIWEPFFTTKGPDKGTGLGLSTVRGIVASHHGFVEVLTAIGHGTTFRAYLPAVPSASPQSDSATPLAPLDGHGECVLVVDDEAPIRDLAEQILGDHGYRVLTCADGMEAMRLIYGHLGEISLVVTDTDMPNVSGFALVRALSQLHPGIRTLAMSGLSRHESAGTEVLEIRKFAHGFLTKPFTAEELLRAIHPLLHPPQKT